MFKRSCLFAMIFLLSVSFILYTQSQTVSQFDVAVSFGVLCNYQKGFSTARDV